MKKLFNQLRNWQYCLKFLIHTVISAIIAVCIFFLLLGYFSPEIIGNVNNTLAKNKDAYIAIGATCAVLSTLFGVFITVGYRIKVEVLSKNRQDWINDLRKNMAEYLKLVYNMKSYNYDHQGNIVFTPHLVTEENHNRLLYITSYVTLLLSPQAKNTQNDRSLKLVKLLEDANLFLFYPMEHDLKSFYEKISEYWENDFLLPASYDKKKFKELTPKEQEEIYLKTKGYILKFISIMTQEILKTEWERVKNGE
ncbi:hypothetical protein [Wohlfahrtiimonas sp. G9077]|uniref:hypothetical protein n=1 Tax=Wohlfahrtiimonas sp. G9077 TaxID=1980118 RepID=UPI000B98E6A5|nr:hypothetical protein [Wohlfahrtiimonas sp. G9077]OYQ75246.1 hypothetical protein B9T20_00700 [Wohlfahrtiimonas sp. G9077]